MRSAILLFFSFLVITLLSASVRAEKITAEEGKKKIAQGALVVDVRSPEEFAVGHIDGAINIPHDAVKDRLAEFGENHDRDIVLYCKSGRRAGLAMEELEKNGFSHVYNSGGYEDLMKASAQ